MSDRQKLLAEITIDEDYRGFPYRDSEKLWTFGKGRCLETHPLTGPEWKQLLDSNWLAVSISVAGSDWLVQTELDAVERQLARDYASFWSQLSDARQNALIEMAYQMGVDHEEAFHDMIGHIRQAVASGSDLDWTLAKEAGLASAWARETPARANKVMTELETGVWT